MKRAHTCPRCGRVVRPPSVFSSAWRCDIHGEVYPVLPPILPTAEPLRVLRSRSRVPVWVPWPLPAGWLATGLTYAEDVGGHARAVAVACTGPSPLGGTGDMVIVAEEPAVGLGARYAGIPGVDPGASMVDTPSHAKVTASGHPTPLWVVAVGEGRVAYAGAATGVWLWVVLWPESTDLLMLEKITLVDGRDERVPLDLPVGALSPKL